MGYALADAEEDHVSFLSLMIFFSKKYFNDSTKYFFGELQMSDMWCLHQLKIFEVAAVSRIELLQLGKNLLGMCEHQKSSKAQDIIYLFAGRLVRLLAWMGSVCGLLEGWRITERGEPRISTMDTGILREGHNIEQNIISRD